MMTPEMQTWLTTNGFVPAHELAAGEVCNYWDIAWPHSSGYGYITFRVGNGSDFGYDIIVEDSKHDSGVNIGVVMTVADVDAIYRLLAATEYDKGPYAQRTRDQLKAAGL